MKARGLRLAALCSIPFVGACADNKGPSGPEVKVNVAPLTLPGVNGVEYALAVFNADPGTTNIFNGHGAVIDTTNLVWQQGSITSNQYGDLGGGDIAYVGPCDADTPGGAPNYNYVAVAIRQIDVGDGNGSIDGTGPFDHGGGAKNVLDDENSTGDGDPDFVNPCNENDACVLRFGCIENHDVSVVFNLTVMRDANQGFFDVAVNFEDIFCSAKYDTCTGGELTAGGPKTVIQDGTTFYVYFDGKSDQYCTYGTGWICYQGGPFRQPSQDASGAAPENGVPPGTLNQGRFTLETSTTVTGAVENDLLFGPDDGDGREWTGVAALACTAGPDSTTAPGDIETTLLLTQPFVQCNSSAGKVTFTLTIDELEQGNNSVPDDENGTNTIYYAVYYGNEDLDCGLGDGSCNKVYYNIAVNAQELADQGLSNCQLFYGATAIRTGDESTFSDGLLIDPDAQYGAITFGSKQGGLPLTGADAKPFCSENPVGGDGSLVQPVYIRGDHFEDSQDFPGFDFSTEGGAASGFGG